MNILRSFHKLNGRNSETYAERIQARNYSVKTFCIECPILPLVLESLQLALRENGLPFSLKAPGYRYNQEKSAERELGWCIHFNSLEKSTESELGRLFFGEVGWMH